MGFLPEGYQIPSNNGGDYTKFSPGKTTLRVLSSAIVGWLGWSESEGKRKPHRTKDMPPAGTYLEKAKPFWSFIVLNRKDESIQICEITQRTIQNGFKELVSDPEWGDPKKYDICITRTGEGLETEYTCVPKPHQKLDDDIVAIIREKLPLINLEALYTGDDPFANLSSQPADEEGDPY